MEELGEHRRMNEWLFSVGDSGIGINPQYHDRVFVMFQPLRSKWAL